MKPKAIYQWALINFIITAVIGLAMRLYPLGLLSGFHYKNWLHTHSHLAFLGWIYPAIIAFLVERHRQPVGKTVAYLFWLMQALVLGLLITFPQYGYGWPSIVVLSLHLVATIWLVFYLLHHPLPEYRMAFGYVRAGAWLLVVSALGALALGPISAMGLKYSPYYFSAIYFYLHFQYNGWFTLAVVGILLTYFHPGALPAQKLRSARHAFRFLLAGIVCTYALSVIGYDVPQWVYVAGGAGAIFQIIGFGLLGGIVLSAIRQRYKTWTPTIRLLFAIATGALILKLSLQLLSAWPALTEFAYRSRDLIIAYLHEYLIGCITLALLALAMMMGWMTMRRYLVRAGLWIFLAGFFLTEAALLLRGMWPVADPVHLQYTLVLGGALLTCALMCLAVGTIDRRKVVERSR